MDNRQCIVLLDEMAKNGNAEAQCALGLLHYQCKGVVKWDPEKAVTLWSLAAEAGNAYAHYNLYCAYGSGRYFPREPEKAMKHLHKAAENGCVQAMRSLGVACFCGSCIPKDNEKAMKWIQLHAGKDLAKESLFLASPLYMDTEVSEKDAWPTSSKLRATEYMSWPLTENKLNIAHDLAAANCSAMEKVEGVLKQVVSGQRLNVERKYENTHTGLCTARVVFVTNSLPAFSDLSDAIFRRTVIIPFLERIPLEEQDPTLTNQILATELPAIFNWGVVGLADVLTHGVFESPASLEIKKRHFATCNRERDFLNSACERHRTGFVSSAQLYANYRVWSAECGCTPIALSSFCQIIETAFPEVERKQRSIEGERIRGYEGIRFVPGDHPENIPNPRPDPETELVISSE